MTDQGSSELMPKSSRAAEMRRYIACALIGYYFANFGTTLWLDHYYVESRPRQPDPAAGLVHSFNEHGAYYFVTASEAAAEALSFWGAWISLLLAFLILPRSKNWRTGLEDFRTDYFAVTLIAVLLSVGLIVFAGPGIASYASSRGITG
jgi:hypothetical protein